MEKEHKNYLDTLRKSGKVNMFGASTYLEEEFGLDRNEAHAILVEWMKGFGDKANNYMTQDKRVEEIVNEYAEAHPCISRCCDGEGTLTVQNIDGEPEQEQCEYCYRQRFPDLDWLRTTLTQYHQDLMSEIERLKIDLEAEKMSRGIDNTHN